MSESKEDFEKYYKAAGLHIFFPRMLAVTIEQNMRLKQLLFGIWEASRRYEKRRLEVKK